MATKTLTADDWITKLGQVVDLDGHGTTEDVQYVLSEIGKPGVRKDMKREVIEKLFTGRSSQGFSVADTLESYPEY